MEEILQSCYNLEEEFLNPADYQDYDELKKEYESVVLGVDTLDPSTIKGDTDPGVSVEETLPGTEKEEPADSEKTEEQGEVEEEDFEDLDKQLEELNLDDFED